MKTVRWGTPSEVAQYEFQDGKRYTERELRDLAEASKIRSEGGNGVPLRVGYVCILEKGVTRYDLDWLPVIMKTGFADDDPLEWPVEPRRPE